MMINFRFNDKTDIEEMMKNKYANKDNPEETIRELARYNYHVLGMKKEDSYDAIMTYMSKNCPDFYEEMYFKTIYRNIASAKKYKFRNVSPVVITRKEIEKIYSINDIRKEKIAFVLLAIAKYYNNISDDNNNRLYISISDLFKLARVAIPCKDRAWYLHFVYEEGILVEHTFVGTNLKIVAFVSNDEPVMELNENDYKELAYSYLNYKSGGYKACKHCGKLFKMSKREPGRLYCKECSQAHETNRFKSMKCVDCGEEFFVDTRNMNKCRCDNCQHEYRNNYMRKLMQKKRESV
jgi:hypothetical protein